jgi:hypothetical protein
MSSYEPNRSRDPRQRDRSRSEIRRPNSTDTIPTSLTVNQSVRSEQSTATNGVLDFFKTLGLNSQLIQALIKANPPKSESIQPPQPSVNNAQEFASFLSQSYGLESTINPPVNRGNKILKITSKNKKKDNYLQFRSSTSTHLDCHNGYVLSTN